MNIILRKMMKLQPDSILSIKEDVLSREVRGEELILSLDCGEYFGLSDVGGYVWQLLAQPRPFSELISAVTEQYDVTHEVAEKDIQNLVSELLTKGLIELRPAS